MTVRHANLAAVFLEEPDNVVGPAQARQCELIADAELVPGSAAARQRPVGLHTKAGVPEQMLDRQLKPMEVSLVAVGRRRDVPNDQRASRLPQEGAPRSSVRL